MATERGFAGSFEGGFRAELARDLGAFDIIPQDEFHVPGTKTRLDFFLPQEPFGVIELKAGPRLQLGRAIEQLVQLKQDLGEEVRLYLVHIQPIGQHDVKLDEFIDIMRSYGEIEVTRGGAVAVSLESKKLRLSPPVPRGAEEGKSEEKNGVI